jgi:hypothetical protein
MNTRTVLTALAALVVVLFAGAYFGSPWFTAWQLMQAAKQRDAAALQSHIDLPAVRASLKGQIDDRLEKSLAKRARKHDALSQLGMLLGATLVDKAVDATVTPETIAQALRTGRAPDPRKSAEPPPEDADTSGDAKSPESKVKVGLAMTGLNSFDMRLSRADDPDRKLTLILRRRGLFDWKLTEVELPPA